MPEELVIILAIVIGAIWLLVKIGKGILNFIDKATKNYHTAAAGRKQDRCLRDRASLRQYLHTCDP